MRRARLARIAEKQRQNATSGEAEALELRVCCRGEKAARGSSAGAGRGVFGGVAGCSVDGKKGRCDQEMGQVEVMKHNSGGYSTGKGCYSSC